MHPKRLPVLLSLMLYPASLLAQSTLTQVDPLVGTQNGGNTTPGAQVPFGPDMTSDSLFTSGYDLAALDAPSRQRQELRDRRRRHNRSSKVCASG